MAAMYERYKKVLTLSDNVTVKILTNGYLSFPTKTIATLNLETYNYLFMYAYSTNKNLGFKLTDDYKSQSSFVINSPSISAYYCDIKKVLIYKAIDYSYERNFKVSWSEPYKIYLLTEVI